MEKFSLYVAMKVGMAKNWGLCPRVRTPA